MNQFKLPNPWLMSKRLRWIGAGIVASTALAVLYMAKAAPVFTPDNQFTGWITRPALSSNDLSGGRENIYRPGYVGGPWYGVLRANHISAAASVAGTSPWAEVDAGVQLNAVTPNNRRIATFSDTASPAGIAFQWNSLSTAQKTSLGTNTTGPQILNFVRGDRSNDTANGGTLRARETGRMLGDIMHSTLLHWNHGQGVKRLYVGANDGMLHVFDAATGQEVYAYVPSVLLPKLPLLASNPYVHKYFVDGPLAAADINFASGQKTMLVGGLGAGGKALFSLDISTTSATAAVSSDAAAAAKIKWEVTSASTGFANLGYTYAMPRFARLNDTTGTTPGTPAVIVGNGYMNTGNYTASLYVINAETGALIREMDTGSGTAAAPNGLSSPTLVDVNRDGKADFAYAGDLNGVMWKFDLTSYAVSQLFTASPTASITTAPVVQRHPNGGYMVAFGTGRTLMPADKTDTAVHYVYGIWDGAPAANAALLAQSVTETLFNTERVRYSSTNTPTWTAGPANHKGWRLALPAGERVVGESPFINEDRMYFTSSNPTVSTTSPTVSAGQSWVTQVNYLTGGGFLNPVFDINNDGLINASDNVGGRVINGGYLGTGVLSQPVLTDLSILSLALFNYNPDGESPPTGIGPGVSGGHFDVDTYYRPVNTGRAATDTFFLGQIGAYGNRLHHHEYDDTYDVTGVNMLNASDRGFNLSNVGLSSTATFKVLVMNQYLNPAARLSVGGDPYESVKTFRNLASETNATTLLNSLPVYTSNTVSSLAFALPLNAFQAMDWWGDGLGVRAGLIPTKTGCVNSVSAAGVPGTPGLNNERFNGALTIQIIRSSTPDTAIELNYAGGGAKYGWRVNAANFNRYVVAEWTYFWHHDNGYCYGDSNWIPNPAQDFGAASRSSTRAPGSTDPQDGSFTGIPGGSGGSGSSGGVGTGTGSTNSGGIVESAESIRGASGRINWREIVRE